ncbi:E3 ubiquitin-protein ligase ATL42-like isoform X1 [Durio zibethinus]|uniref:RING-type E3 ubiquitin transferase n=1 Tax=Durio zibethinus TaxID=66656 RepID=A0A6P5ZH95_DURZI|nr:E3 ubiquitin-protein ligase ATL42-like isoform X1 [Durio zibethinus]
MIRLRVISLVLLFLLFHVDAQSPSSVNNPATGDAVSNFRPSLAVVIGILCVMFTLTFFLLVYAKCCHRGATVHGNHPPRILHRTRSQLSGIDKKVIESLPFFKFSSLKGSKQGLECAVCLSKFEDIEILRLLPNCKHAFHINCIDQWLEKHSSCPLCRQKVNAKDQTIFTYSNSMRFLLNQSELREDSDIELYVQREQENGSSRFSIGSSFRKTEKGDIENEVLIQEEDCDKDGDGRAFHKFNHKIIVSDVVLKNRWSSVSSSDLMFLNSEMLNDISSNRFSSLETDDVRFTKTRPIENEQIMKIKEEMEIKRLFERKVSSINKDNPVSAPGLPSTSNSAATSSHTSRVVNQAEKRSMSEITAVSRFRDVSTRNRMSESSLSETYTKEERIRRLWLPIARRTVQWFANRERRSQQSQNTTQHLDV